jgi:hypothetical protein
MGLYHFKQVHSSFSVTFQTIALIKAILSNVMDPMSFKPFFFFYGNTLSHHLLYSTIIRRIISNYTTFFPSLHTFKFSYYIHFKLEITSFLHQLILFFLSFLLLNFKSIFLLAHVFFCLQESYKTQFTPKQRRGIIASRNTSKYSIFLVLH